MKSKNFTKKSNIQMSKKEIITNQYQEFLNYITREQTLTLWTHPTTDRHCLIEEKHGDGKQLICFQTMDSRPFNYYIRVDSNLNLDHEDHEVLNQKDRDEFGCFSEMIMQMIEQEHDNIDRYQEQEDGLYTNDQDRDEGHPPFKYKWPMFSLGAGYSLGVVDVEMGIRAMIGNKRA